PLPQRRRIHPMKGLDRDTPEDAFGLVAETAEPVEDSGQMMGFRRDVIRLAQELRCQEPAYRCRRALLLEQHIAAHDRDNEGPTTEQTRGPAVKAIRVMHMHDVRPTAEQKAHKSGDTKDMAQGIAADTPASACQRP